MAFSLPVQMFQKDLCQIILKSMHKCRSYALTSSICDHFIIWPSSVALTFNLPLQMFQMALLLIKENNCAKLFWNPCINVEVMARTSSIYDNFIIWHVKCDPDLQPTWKNVSNGTSTLQGVAFSLPEKMFQMALVLLKENNCAKLFSNPCINLEVMACRNPDGCTTHACTYTVLEL